MLKELYSFSTVLYTPDQKGKHFTMSWNSMQEETKHVQFRKELDNWEYKLGMGYIYLQFPALSKIGMYSINSIIASVVFGPWETADPHLPHLTYGISKYCSK